MGVLSPLAAATVLPLASVPIHPRSRPALPSVRGFHGRGFYGGGYYASGFYGTGFYGTGFYATGWHNPYWGAPYGGYCVRPYSGPYSGELKLDTKVKDAQVCIDGAYAGATHQNKSMHLRPGNHNMEIREADRAAFSQRVYVIAGQNLTLAP